MLVKKYKSQVISINSPVEGIYILEFRSLGLPFRYHPGQFLHLAIDAEYDGINQWPESRCFSMQSNPNEETIRITYSVKGGFTRQMERCLKIGSEVWIKLPYGNLFTQPHNKSNTVFIAGGTGITPFLSLFSHESFREYKKPKIYLGFRSKAYNIYGKELNAVKCDGNTGDLNCFRIFYQDVTGMIDINRIFKENGTGSSYFISGPPAMINAFKKILVENETPGKNIITDDWE